MSKVEVCEWGGFAYDVGVAARVTGKHVKWEDVTASIALLANADAWVLVPADVRVKCIDAYEVGLSPVFETQGESLCYVD